MLLTPISAHKNASPRLCKTSVAVEVDVLHAFIDKIQVDIMASIKSRARKTVNNLSTSV